MKIVRTYIRLSQKDRHIEDDIDTSIVNAKSEASIYCKKFYNCELDKIYIEKYITGDDPNRLVLNQMIEDAKKGEFNILIVRSLSRLTREGSEKQEDYIILLGYYGVEVVSMTEDAKNELNRFIFGFVHRLPIILARIYTKQMRQGKQAQGKAYVKAPFGYKNVKKSNQYWIYNKDAEKVREVFSMHLKGFTLDEIMKALKLSYKVVHKILNNVNYVGIKLPDGSYKSIINHIKYIKDSNKIIINKEKVAYLGFHEPLISPEDWLKIHPEDKDNELMVALCQR